MQRSSARDAAGRGRVLLLLLLYHVVQLASHVIPVVLQPVGLQAIREEYEAGVVPHLLLITDGLVPGVIGHLGELAYTNPNGSPDSVDIYILKVGFTMMEQHP